MSDLFLLSRAQMDRIKPFFPRSHGVPRVDDRRVVSGIVYVIRNGLQWKDAPRAYGPRVSVSAPVDPYRVVGGRARGRKRFRPGDPGGRAGGGQARKEGQAGDRKGQGYEEGHEEGLKRREASASLNSG